MTIASRVRRKQRQLSAEIAALEHELEELRLKEQMLCDILGKKPVGAGEAPSGRRRGAKTISEEIVDLLEGSSEALSTREIIEGLAQRGVEAAATSIYSSINRLKKQGVLGSKDHPGRGDAYVVADASKLVAGGKPGPKPGRKKKQAKKKPVRKPSKKKSNRKKA